VCGLPLEVSQIICASGVDPWNVHQLTPLACGLRTTIQNSYLLVTVVNQDAMILCILSCGHVYAVVRGDARQFLLLLGSFPYSLSGSWAVVSGWRCGCRRQ
jgi:hypothetical protein